jgi:hypothetical protein
MGTCQCSLWESVISELNVSGPIIKYSEPLA